MSTFGRRVASHFGSHQAARPASAMAAGTSVMRTRNASKATPIASANAIALIAPEPSGTNAKKTKNMMSAAAVTTRAACWKPCTIERARFAGLHELLAHARHEEHLVVHREAEEHGHEQDRQEAEDRAGLDVQELGEPAPLEDRDA